MIKAQNETSTLFRMGVFFLAALTLVAGSARGQQKEAPQDRFLNRPTAPAGVANAPTVLVDGSENYRVGPGDVIEVTIEDAPELSKPFIRVTAEGTFLMPYLGRVTAQGKTIEELSKLLADGLRGRYLKDPNVSVAVKQYNSRSFFIQGAVRSPGVYQVEGRPSLLKLITVAGGLAETHGSSAFIIRELKPEKGGGEAGAAPDPEAEDGAQYELRKVNISGLLKGRFDQNMFLEPGDIVNIPPVDVFFVAGEVNGPGSFPLKEGTTLRQAISLAQGTTFKARMGKGVIFREDPATGKRKEIPVDIGAVMGGKKQDVEIVANDVIIVPNSTMKAAGGALLNAFGMSTARLPIRY